MLKPAAQFISLLAAALVAGVVFGIWRGYDPTSFSGPVFVAQHQNAVRGLNVLIPVIGAVGILATAIWAYLELRDKTTKYVLIGATMLLIVSALITRFGNQPINATVMTWAPDSPPSNWQELRDSWWSFHVIRTGTMFLALSLLLAGIIRKANSNFVRSGE